MPKLTAKDIDIDAVREIMAVNQDVYLDKSRKKLPGGWVRVFDSAGLDGNRTEGFFGALYCKEDQYGKKWMVCFRGYNGRTDVDDLYSAVIGDDVPEQVRDACRFTQKALEKFALTIENVNVVGHSMGGYLSKAVGIAMNAKEVFAFSALGLRREHMAPLRKLSKEFSSAAEVTVSRLNKITTSIYSTGDATPKSGDYHGKELALVVDKNPHLMKSLEVALLRSRGVTNPYAQSIVPRPKRWGFKNFVYSIGVD